ncbi:Uncharacterized protein OBRU01_02127 [Operophtera brumata]|uniref:Uncharacterized protein n=1 Tax=Operophtera brumata TaxID=104452 RepID=A0A0L7LSU9_OPEBR|nr:Uncharacterized protein OBRU01_02127 [Operophtera brumata]
MADLYRANHALVVIHLVSGAVPLAMALAGNENVQLGNMMIACNIISLCHYSVLYGRVWGWYTAGAGLYTYFVAPQGTKMAYPLGLALLEYCACGVFHVRFNF